MSKFEGSGPGAPGTHINRRHLLAAFATLAGALVVSGCSADSNSATASPTATTGPVTPPEKPAKIVMRAWGEPYSTSLAATAGASFTAKTGIPVEFDLTDFPEMKAKIDRSDDSAPKRLPPAERSARYDKQVKKLTGLSLVVARLKGCVRQEGH